MTQTSVKTHYAAVALPALLAAAVFAAARFDRRLAYARSAGLAGRDGRRSARSAASTCARTRTTQAARRALALVPDTAPVSATNALGAHLSARQRIFSFPVLDEAEWVAVDTHRLTYLDSLKPDRARAPLAALRRDPRWRLVFSEDGVLVFRRRLERESSAGAGRRRSRARRAARGGRPRPPRAAPPRSCTTARATGSSPAAGTRRDRDARGPARPRARARPGPQRSATAASAERDRVRHAELLDPVRERVARLALGVPRERAERTQPVETVTPGRERHEHGCRDARSRDG